MEEGGGNGGMWGNGGNSFIKVKGAVVCYGPANGAGCQVLRINDLHRSSENWNLKGWAKKKRRQNDNKKSKQRNTIFQKESLCIISLEKRLSPCNEEIQKHPYHKKGG